MKITIKNGVTIIETGMPSGVQNTTGVYGVSYNKQQKKYVVQLKVKGKIYYVGAFKELEVAAKIRKEADAAKECGEFVEWFNAYKNK